MIQSAKNNLLKNTNSALPNMSETIKNWFLNISFEYVTRTMQGAEWVTSEPITINTRGVVRPLSDKDLKILPEGTWAWEWLQIHCLPDVFLDTNQFVKYDDKTYKVMAKKDYSKYGYIRYTLLEAFRAEELS